MRSWHYVLRAAVYKPADLVGRQRERVAHRVARVGVVLEVGHLLAARLELLGCVESDVGFAFAEQAVHVFLINGPTLGLAIRAVVAADADAFVEPDAQPLERFYDVFLGARHEAVGVGVLDAENEFAAVLAGKEVVVEGGTYAADVERPGRAGCEAHPNFRLSHDMMQECLSVTRQIYNFYLIPLRFT